jgi:hypothetical protein
MFNRLRTIFLLLALLVVLVVPGAATDMRDEVVGSWVSSSGTPLQLTAGDNVQLVLLRIDGGPPVDCWLSSGRDDKIHLYYKAADGTEMRGTLDQASQTITVQSESGFKAVWRRK